MANDLARSVAALKGELQRLENLLRQAEGCANGEAAAPERVNSLALLPTLPAAAEIRTRLEIRFAERVQDRLGGIIAEQVGNRLAGSSEAGDGGVLGEVKVVDVGGVNVHVHTGTATTAAPGSTVIPCGKQQDQAYQDSAEATRSFWFNLEQAEIAGQKDAIRQKAEDAAKQKARAKAEQEARNAVCSGGNCASGTRCATFPAALIHEPTIVASDASYSDSEGWAGSAGSSVKGTATAQCTVTYNCPCM